MKGKLIKTSKDYYHLGVEKSNYYYGHTSPGFCELQNKDGSYTHKLSLKNCQAIERGYDLNEIKRKLFGGFDGQPDSFTIAAVERTVEIMFEILGDKKYSEQDVRDAYFHGEKDSYTKGGQTKEMENQFIQSLQQTEWDVEIVMACVIGCENLILNGENSLCCGNKKPKLDADGCIILKRKL